MHTLSWDGPYMPDLEAENGLVQILEISDIFRSPENDLLYKPTTDQDDPNMKALAASVRENGILEPLVLTKDRFILSGHRRYTAACMAGLRKIPCRVHADISRHKMSTEQYVTILREFNRQREKNDAERLREEIVSANPEEAYRVMMEHRENTSGVNLPAIELRAKKTRSAISEARTPLLYAAIRVVNELRPFWPVSIRQIHYRLLNAPPLLHAKKPGSIYQNNLASYKVLSDLLTRARLKNTISMDIIADETRPISLWQADDTTTTFLRRELDGFLKGYYRNLQQGQPNHIEIVGEKNTVQGILKRIAGQYCIPLTIGRGYSSLPPRSAMSERFLKSGKKNLILLVVSDFDPDGEEICHSFARSMRDDFEIQNIHPIKVGLTHEQVRRLKLPPSMEAKEKSSNYAKFVEKYGTNAYELEAVAPEQLQQWLRGAIDSVMDIKAFNAELDKAKQDAVQLDRIRRTVHAELKEIMQEKMD